ncbi:hypothetical protein EES42_43855 [Streptomyces sp. ADI95-17]|nr:hypothetical protein EES42_43855 [Streptomyces sp. ADI95-17]
MVLLYGQTPARTCRLTTAHVIQDDKGVALQLHEIPLRLPPPLDTLVLQLVDIATVAPHDHGPRECSHHASHANTWAEAEKQVHIFQADGSLLRWIAAWRSVSSMGRTSFSVASLMERR